MTVGGGIGCRGGAYISAGPVYSLGGLDRVCFDGEGGGDPAAEGEKRTRLSESGDADLNELFVGDEDFASREWLLLSLPLRVRLVASCASFCTSDPEAVDSCRQS